MLIKIVDFLNTYLWGYVLIYLLLGAGIYFTIRLRFAQISHFSHMLKLLMGSRNNKGKGISSFQALCTTLASRVGTGNIAGVAIAIYIGGPGAIFWMWLIATIGMATAFGETVLAQLYKVSDKNGGFRGGPAYYMRSGMNSNLMSIIFSVFLIFTFGFAFNGVQSNSISIAMNVAFDVPKYLTGIIIAFLTATIICGGLRNVAKVSEFLVPIMALIYLIITVIVLILNIAEIPAMFKLIIYSAFGIKQASGAVVGYTISNAMMQGIKRGLFSNEAGMGSAPNAAASAVSHPTHPALQGYVQMLGPFIDTIVICTCTAMIILLSGQSIAGSNLSGVELTQQALSFHIGPIGKQLIAIVLLFFSFTTIIGNYAYAETNMMFLKGGGFWKLNIFRLAVVIMVFFGAITEMPVVWSIADLSMGLMALTNLIAILYLSKTVFIIARDYNQKLKSGKECLFNINDYPQLKNKITSGLWQGKDHG
jgi:AGCS family alanine or glycine:cation symporter